MKIPLSKPDVGEREVELVSSVLRSGRLSLGSRLAEFEQEFAAFVGARHAIAVSSGTSALHLCVRALEIGADDEVLTTSFSFVASANCLLYERAVPVFVDIDPATLNIDPAKIRATIARDYIWDGKRLINRRSGRVLKAILPVHVFGMPCDMAPILQTAEAFNLRVLEDACEALGATYRGQPAGTFGHAAAFAFYPNKQMTTGEGGMVITNDADVADVCRSLRNQGRDAGAGWLRHVHLGYNYRLSELHCALGLAQLERLEELLASRDRLARSYADGLADVPGLLLPGACPGSKRSWFVYVVQLLGASAAHVRNDLMEDLLASGIACQTYFPAIHQQPYFREMAGASVISLPHTELASETCLALPFFPSMKKEEVETVCRAVKNSLAKRRKLRRHVPFHERIVPSAPPTEESEQSIAAR